MTPKSRLLTQSVGIQNTDNLFQKLEEIFWEVKLSPATMEAIQRLFSTANTLETPTLMAERILDAIKSDPNYAEMEPNILKANSLIQWVLENTPDGFFVAADVRWKIARLKLPRWDQKYVGAPTYMETRRQEFAKGTAFTIATGAMTYGFQQAMMWVIEKYYAQAMNAREVWSFWELAKNGGDITTIMTSAISLLAAVGIQVGLSAAQKYDWSRRLREVMLGQEYGKKHAKKWRNYVTWTAIAILAWVLTVEVWGLAKHTAQSANVWKASFDVSKKIHDWLSVTSTGSEASRLATAYSQETANIKAYADKFYRDETSGARAWIGARAVAKYALTDLYSALADPRLGSDPVLKAAVQWLLDDIDRVTQNAEFRAIPSFAWKAEWVSSLVMGDLADLERSGTSKFDALYKTNSDGKVADSADFYKERNAFDKEWKETIERLNSLLWKWGQILDAYQRFMTTVADRSNATSTVQIPPPPWFAFVKPDVAKVMSDVDSINPELEWLNTFQYIQKVWQLTGVEWGISKWAALLFWLSVFIRSGLVEGILITILGRLRKLREKYLSEPGKTIHQQRTHVRSYYYDMIGEIYALYDTSIRPQLPQWIPALSPSDMGYLVDTLLVKVHPESAALFSHKNTESFGKRVLTGMKIGAKTALIWMNFDTLDEREIKILDRALLKLTDPKVIRDHVQQSLFATTHEAASPNQMQEQIRQFEAQSIGAGNVFGSENEAKKYADRMQKWYNTDKAILDAMKSANPSYTKVFQMFEEQLAILVRDPVAFGRKNYFDLNVWYHVISQLLQKHSHPDFWASSGNKPIHTPNWITRQNKERKDNGQIGLIGGYAWSARLTSDELQDMIIAAAESTISALGSWLIILPADQISRDMVNGLSEDTPVDLLAVGMPQDLEDLWDIRSRSVYIEQDLMVLPTLPNTDMIRVLLEYLVHDKPEDALRKLHEDLSNKDDTTKGDAIRSVFVKKDVPWRNTNDLMTSRQALELMKYWIFRIQCIGVVDSQKINIEGIEIAGASVRRPSDAWSRQSGNMQSLPVRSIVLWKTNSSWNMAP